MEIPAARWIVSITILLILVVTAIYVVKVFRDFAFGGRPSPSQHLDELRKLKEVGALNESEYVRARNTLQTSSIEPIKFEPTADEATDGKLL